MSKYKLFGAFLVVVVVASFITTDLYSQWKPSGRVKELPGELTPPSAPSARTTVSGRSISLSGCMEEGAACGSPYYLSKGLDEKNCPEPLVEGRECYKCKLYPDFVKDFKCKDTHFLWSYTAGGTLIFYNCQSKCGDKCFDDQFTCIKDCQKPDENGVAKTPFQIDQCQELCKNNFPICVDKCGSPSEEGACHHAFSFSYYPTLDNDDYNCIYDKNLEEGDICKRCGFKIVASSASHEITCGLPRENFQSR